MTNKNEEYFQACRSGDMEKIKAETKLLNIVDSHYQFRKAVSEACLGKQLDVVKYLFNEIPEERKKHYAYHFNFENFGNSITDVCANGAIDILDFFRNYSGGITNLHNFEMCARTAYTNGQLDTIKYLLATPEANYFINQRKYYNSIFATDYPKGNNVAKYFLNDEELSKSIRKTSLLEKAFRSNNVGLVEYLIFDMDMQYSKKVRNAVQFLKSETLDIPHLFINREKIRLAEALHAELNNDKEKSKRLKL